MKPSIKNAIAVITGLIVGSAVNMSLVNLGHYLLPIEGLDPNDMAALSEVMATLSAEYFLFPFLAHAFGTLVGAFVVAKMATSHKFNFAVGIGGFFFLGGIAASVMIPAPTWFVVSDLLLAYAPMAWIGGKLGSKNQ